MTNIGDIVLNPKDPGSVCVIIAIDKKGGYFVLSPITKQGWPSTSSQNWQRYNLPALPKMKQNKKYPRLLLCPSCNKPNKILMCPLRWVNMYRDSLQCKNCKKWYTKAGGVYHAE